MRVLLAMLAVSACAGDDDTSTAEITSPTDGSMVVVAQPLQLHLRGENVSLFGGVRVVIDGGSIQMAQASNRTCTGDDCEVDVTFDGSITVGNHEVQAGFFIDLGEVMSPPITLTFVAPARGAR